jgi:nucleotidyltransferase substrate binding protein (TIGR01987 family)
MLSLNVEHLATCITTLQAAIKEYDKQSAGAVLHDIYRAACVKEFELILEQSGKLLKKCLRDYFASPKESDRLVFKDIFRMAAKHDLISLDEAERWLTYRDTRNETAHDYGEDYADKTMNLLHDFSVDAESLLNMIREKCPHAPTS